MISNEQPDAHRRIYADMETGDWFYIRCGAIPERLVEYVPADTRAAAQALGLFAVFYDGETRPVAAFVLEQDATRYAENYSGGELTWEIRHVQVVEDFAPAALPEIARDETVSQRTRTIRAQQRNPSPEVTAVMVSSALSETARAREIAQRIAERLRVFYDPTLVNMDEAEYEAANIVEEILARTLTEAQPAEKGFSF